MRYELADYEWVAIKPMLPNKPRGVPRVNDRRVLNGIFWVLRSGAPWRDLPDHFGPYTTCYNRFVRWRRAGVWGRIIDALAAAHDAAADLMSDQKGMECSDVESAREEAMAAACHVLAGSIKFSIENIPSSCNTELARFERNGGRSSSGGDSWQRPVAL